MGKYDSSKTRVEPLFDELLRRDASGATWLDTLIGLGSRVERVATIPKGLRLVPEHGKRWGSAEMKLPAPSALLEYLVQNVDAARLAASTDTGETRAMRERLAKREPETVARALAALRSGERGKKWFVLEGDSSPDAVLETADTVTCIEGKRTESGCTTETTWMPLRSQLIRHMDAAMEKYPAKRVLGLLMVEGSEPDPLRVSQFWSDQADAQASEEMIAGSLPHRSAAEQRAIADGILGAVTWQGACVALNVDPSILLEKA